MKNWSRKQKLTLCLLILLVSLFIIFTISGWPSPTPEIALRRMEKRMLIGPTEIISELDFTDSVYDHLWIGKSEYGYTTFEYNDSPGWDEGTVRYFPKTEDATLFCTYYWYGQGSEKPWLPIFLFPENQGTVDVKISLTVTIDDESRSYQLDGTRKDSSFFLFSLPAEELGGKHFWLLQQTLTGAYSEYVLSGTVDIEIEFFDVSDQVVDTYSRTFTK